MPVFSPYGHVPPHLPNVPTTPPLGGCHSETKLVNLFWIWKGVNYEYIQIQQCVVTSLVLCAVLE